MKLRYQPFLLLTALSATALAGPEEPIAPPVKNPDAFSWLTPTINVRARLEVRDVDGFDPSTAFTVRERLGLKLGEFGGFSAFAEGEFTQAIGDDYRSFPLPVGAAPAANLEPARANNSTIADPENAELNRAWVQYKGFDTTLKLGRQRIKLNNDAFVGNVGWRQNEQTFDAIRFDNSSIDNLDFTYIYSDRVQRIFGDDARGGLHDWEGDFHFVNAKYTGIDGLDLSAYLVAIDFDPGQGPASGNGVTYGVIGSGKANGLNLYGEVAYQTADETGFDDAFYTHLKASKKFGKHTVGINYEFLGEDFNTPFATVHAFNGFADVFALRRLGLGGGHGDIHDVYLSHSTKLPGGIVWKNWFHYIDAEDRAGADLSGWEYDSVFVKKFGKGFTGIAKFYHFEAESDSLSPTTTGFTLGLNYNF